MNVVRILSICIIGAAMLQITDGRECACATSNVNIRSGPGTSYAVQGVLYTPTCLTSQEVSTQSGSYTWAKVEYNSGDGWIADSYLSISTCGSAFHQCACASTNVNVRSGAGTSNGVLVLLSSGSCLPYKGNEITSGNYNWAHVDYNGKDAFVASSYVSYSACAGFCNTDMVPSGCPTIISRSGWSARSPVSTPTSMSGTPGKAFIHHGTGSTCTTQSSCISKVQSYQDHHMDTNNWNDIGYSFIIGEDGNVYEGRGWGIVGAHTYGHNSISLGFCVIGDYSSHTPNSVAITALRRLIQCGVDSGYLTSDYVLQGHRDVVSTACPGQDFYELIQTWPHYKDSLC